jgi:hypothetical protein
VAYLPDFENDVFVSYRRASNDIEDPWVDTFCRALRASLKELVGEVEIWRDKDRLRIGQDWRPEIDKAIEHAAIFLAIVSRTYFDSDECRREFDGFLGHVKRATAGGDSRTRKIFPIFKQPLKPDQNLPSELRAIDDHKFFDWHPPGSPRFREFSPERSDEEKVAFRAALGRLAQDLMATLEDLNGRARQNALGKVFLARVSPELQQDRQRLRADLHLGRYLVLPEHEYLWNADDHRAVITKDLEEAQLCIHLVARTASSEPLASERAKLQLALAHEIMKSKGRHPPVVWVQPASATDPSAAELLTYIERDLANHGVEYLHGGLEDFKTHVYGLLQGLTPGVVVAPASEESKPITGPTATGLPQIAVLVDEGDLDEVKPVTALLADRLGVEPRRIKFKGPLPKDPSRLSTVLDRSQHCLIFWAHQPEEWVTDLLDSQALATLGRWRTCVYAAGPTTNEKSSFRTGRAYTILAKEGGPDEKELRAFLDDPGPT